MHHRDHVSILAFNKTKVNFLFIELCFFGVRSSGRGAVISFVIADSNAMTIRSIPIRARAQRSSCS